MRDREGDIASQTKVWNHLNEEWQRLCDAEDKVAIKSGNDHNCNNLISATSASLPSFAGSCPPKRGQGRGGAVNWLHRFFLSNMFSVLELRLAVDVR